MKHRTKEILDELMGRCPNIYAIKESILGAFAILNESFSKKGKLLVCGNGGSAADADHIVGELVKSFKLKREMTTELQNLFCEYDVSLVEKLQMGLPAINLSAQSALLSAIVNDNGADMVFAQQVFAYGQANDCFLGLSTSGNSKNVILAAKVASILGMKTIGMTGENKCELDGICDIVIKAPSRKTFMIQEIHLPIYHALCAMLEEEFFGQEEAEE